MPTKRDERDLWLAVFADEFQYSHNVSDAVGLANRAVEQLRQFCYHHPNPIPQEE